MKPTYLPKGYGRSTACTRELPADLSEWFSSSTLIQEIWNAIDSVNWPVVARTGGESCPEPVMRTVVVYCFASGIYSSKDIEDAASHDPVVRYLCARSLPRWEQVRDFRRRNALFLKKTLIALFSSAYLRQLAIEEENYSYWSLGKFNFQHDPDFAVEADERLKRAIQADSMALDY